MIIKDSYLYEDETPIRFTKTEEIKRLELLRDVHQMGIIGCSRGIEKYYRKYPDDIEFLLMICNLNNNFVTYLDMPNVFSKSFRDSIKNNKKFFI